MNLSYIINRLGEDNENYYNAVAPPIIQTSNFSYKTVNDLRLAINDEKNNLIYSRGNNPTLDILVKKLAALEKAEDAIVFASGMAAISTAIIANVAAGDHVICVQEPYSWTNKLLSSLLPRFGVECSFINGGEISNYQQSLKPNTKLIYLESPNTFTFELQDLKAVAAFARQNNLTTIIDNSYSTPLFQNPIEFGIDIVVHSATKYIGGHSDTVAGVLCSSKEIVERIFKNEFLTFGGIISPFNAWLLLRGLRTLPIRMEKIAKTTSSVINFLENHSKIEKVIYPFSKDFPQLELAESQMKCGSGMLSVLLKTNEIPKIEAFCNALKCFYIAVSWGGYESLVFPVCSFVNDKEESPIPFNLVRFSIGLEEPEELIQDIENALKFL